MVIVVPVTPFHVEPPLLAVNLSTQGAAYWENGSWWTPDRQRYPPRVTPLATWTVPTGPRDAEVVGPVVPPAVVPPLEAPAVVPRPESFPAPVLPGTFDPPVTVPPGADADCPPYAPPVAAPAPPATLEALPMVGSRPSVDPPSANTR